MSCCALVEDVLELMEMRMGLVERLDVFGVKQEESKFEGHNLFHISTTWSTRKSRHPS